MTMQTINLTTFIFITLLTLVEVPALTLLRMGGMVNIFIASLLFALGVVPLLSVALQYEGIGLVNFFWNIQSTIIMLAVGIVFFKEKISTLQMLGIAISLLGMSMVVLSKE